MSPIPSDGFAWVPLTRLRSAPRGLFLIRALENLDRGNAKRSATRPRRKDTVTARFQAAAATWRDVVGWSDECLTEQIRRDRIDILFDLSGHTGGNRLLVFARKPAPIQVTWAGYVGTTGLRTMDYILADRYESLRMPRATTARRSYGCRTATSAMIHLLMRPPCHRCQLCDRGM